MRLDRVTDPLRRAAFSSSFCSKSGFCAADVCLFRSESEKKKRCRFLLSAWTTEEEEKWDMRGRRAAPCLGALLLSSILTSMRTQQHSLMSSFQFKSSLLLLFLHGSVFHVRVRLFSVCVLVCVCVPVCNRTNAFSLFRLRIEREKIQTMDGCEDALVV